VHGAGAIQRRARACSAVYTAKRILAYLSAIPADGILAAHSSERKIRHFRFQGSFSQGTLLLVTEEEQKIR
jgi:hypothetical protein